MTADAPAGWEEVFDGACLHAEVLQANGLKPVMRQLEAADLLPTVGFDRCRVYVTDAEASKAREVLEESRGA
ncbi:hypothetical protein [Candidatus Nephthysia bennettiae]|uniref:Uncharacterized protein n=1 Tax=Candidatus Nephthysia bennettiae TaxID=3127016 RepID=A0A934N9B6_9BACT|nr:hypothetical protein [Candidatus Dormibacteraeota bacterium]MBJ7610901.1 hypothetical protein [Candidatus Dormibacteraeota bacterium]